MKLKTRIMTLVGSLLLGSFFLSALLGIFFSRETIFKTNTLLQEDFDQYEVHRQKEVSNYLDDKINAILAIISGTLERTKEVQYWNFFFSPSQFNLETNLWQTTALFLMSNKTLDLVQTVINNKVTSSIILDRPPPYRVYNFDLHDEIKLCVVDPQVPDVKMDGPFIGIPYLFDAQIVPEVLGELSSKQPLNLGISHYLLFTPEQIMQFNPKLFDIRVARFMGIDLANQKDTEYPMNLLEITEMKKALPMIRDSIVKAQVYFKANPGYYQYITKNKTTWFQDQFHNLYDVVPGQNIDYDEFGVIKSRYEQITMIWQYASLIATGFSDYNIDDSAPVGFSTIDTARKNGLGILIGDIFNNPPVEVVSPSIFRSEDRIFLGDSTTIDLKTDSGIRQTFLTLGIDIRDLFKGLALVTTRSLLLIVNQEILYATNEKGDQIEIDPSNFPLINILGAPTGTYQNKDGQNFIFLTTKLFPDENVYIVLYCLKSEEFGIIDRVNAGLKAFSNRLSFQTALIALITSVLAFILLSRLSQYITNPIMILAKNTKEVQEGHLDQVKLPKVEDGTEDEIEDLYESFSEMVDGLKEKEKVKGILNKVVSPKIANKILQGNVSLGGEEKVVTVLFADIRHFTEMTEHMKPSELIQVLNSFMTKLSDVIDRHNGVIDKYVGDEVMALFGAPISEQDSVCSAVSCAIAMMKEVEAWNQTRMELKLPPIEIGIGIHTGNVVAGNVGAENRLNYTVLGANVNLAARLCSAAEEKQILTSEDTLNSTHVKELVDFHELAPMTLKGFSKPIKIFEIFEKKSQAPKPS